MELSDVLEVRLHTGFRSKREIVDISASKPSKRILNADLQSSHIATYDADFADRKGQHATNTEHSQNIELFVHLIFWLATARRAPENHNDVNFAPEPDNKCTSI